MQAQGHERRERRDKGRGPEGLNWCRVARGKTEKGSKKGGGETRGRDNCGRGGRQVSGGGALMTYPRERVSGPRATGDLRGWELGW